MALKKKAKHKSPASKRRIVIIVLIICSITLCQNISQEKRKGYYLLKINTIEILAYFGAIKNPSILEGFLSEWKGGILDLWFRIWVKAIFQSLTSQKPHHNSIFPSTNTEKASRYTENLTYNTRFVYANTVFVSTSSQKLNAYSQKWRYNTEIVS